MTVADIAAAIADPAAGKVRPPGGRVAPGRGTNPAAGATSPADGGTNPAGGGANPADSPVSPADSPVLQQVERVEEARVEYLGGQPQSARPAIGGRARRSPSAEDAAVALVFAGRDGDLRLCFIRRATHPRDPWSGQMALPGGRATAADDSLRAAAVRETREEVGLSLAAARYLGALPTIPLMRGGRPTAGTVAPFVFYLSGAPPALTVDPAEVAAGYWIAVRHLRDAGQRTVLRMTGNGVTRRLPAIRFRSHLIWGMTYRIVTALLDRADRAATP